MVETNHLQNFELRAATADDAARVADVFLRSSALLNFLPDLHSPEEHAKFIALTIAGKFTTDARDAPVIIAENSEDIQGFVALRENWIDHLYVAPEMIGRGVGRALLARAKDRYAELSLWCFEQNSNAQRFYEYNGFKVQRRTDGSGNEQNCPDILYQWRRLADVD